MDELKKEGCQAVARKIQRFTEGYGKMHGCWRLDQEGGNFVNIGIKELVLVEIGLSAAN